jgi:hypothetical protein
MASEIAEEEIRMEETRLIGPNVFLTFGIGALLLLSLFLPLPLIPKIISLGEGSADLPDSGHLWTVIAAALVFSIHSMGLLMLAFGSIPIGKLASRHAEAEESFFRLLHSANERVWAVALENRQSLRFMCGLVGICLVHVWIAAVALVNWALGISSEMLYDLTILPVFIGGLTCFLLYSSVLNMQLVAIELRQEIQSVKANQSTQSKPTP